MIRSLPAHLAIFLTLCAAAPSPVVTAARPIARGAVIRAEDLTVTSADHAAWGALGDPADAVGMTTRRAIAAGVPVRADALARPALVRRGDPVTLRAAGPGFSVEMAGTASADAAEGDAVAAVNATTGKRLRGPVGADGSISLGDLNFAAGSRHPQR